MRGFGSKRRAASNPPITRAITYAVPSGLRRTYPFHCTSPLIKAARVLVGPLVLLAPPLAAGPAQPGKFRIFPA